MSTRPAVTISREPWGEAQIDLPGSEPLTLPKAAYPWITCGTIYSIAPDIALWMVRGRMR